MRRFMIMGAVAAAVVAVAGLALVFTLPQPGGEGAAAALPPANFVLVDQNGRTVREADLLQKPTVIFFGYTFCPEACPTTLARLEVLMKTLGPQAKQLNVAFVTIDPARDTPGQLKQYLAAFDPRFIGLTGSQAAVDKAAKEYGVFYQKEPLPGGGYSMDHSTAVYLVDRKRGFSEILAPDQAQADQLDALKRLLGARSA
ncbi:MAG TPA: SCO family protein [Caulobacteraceae bacterium]|jgi:protein SCO1/2|nr:SCO family protein [Caulobacteraceae bacterium]